MNVGLCNISSMQQKRPKRKFKARGDTRFPGICRHARLLGVNRATLYRVLDGQWNLPTLRGRYEKLIRGEEASS